MFEEVLVGIDRPFRGRDALALAKLLVADDGELTLVHVYSGDPRLSGEHPTEYEAVERERALNLLTGVRNRAGVKAELACTEAGSVGRGLRELAECGRADLLVVGSSRLGPVGRVLLGDDACAAMSRAPCAVAIAPTGFAQRSAALREIGVAYNGSAESDHALSVARTLAATNRASLSACHVVSLPTYAFLAGPPEIGDAIDELVEDARERLAALDHVVPRVVYGNAVEELTRFSESLDLLVVGSRDYGPVGRLVHGSTTRQLIHTVRCPLLVLTRAAREAAATRLSADGSRAAAAAPAWGR